MQRQRGELDPIGDALSGMGGPVQAIREASLQARHHFTQADQVNLLVSARESGPRARLHAPHDGAVLPAAKQTPATGSNTSASTGHSRST